MILLWLIVILLIAGLLASAAAHWSHSLARWIALGAVTFDFALALWLWARHFHEMDLLPRSAWLEQINWSWIPSWGVRFHLAMDGLSLLLLLLAFSLGIVSVLASWREIQDGVGFFLSLIHISEPTRP